MEPVPTANSSHAASSSLFETKFKLSASNGTPRPIRSGPSDKIRMSYDMLRRNQELLNSKRKCQVDPSCPELAIFVCSEKAYRGCTMAFCNNHSGQENRRRKQFCICRLCTKDKHVDICSECSNDIINAQRKFYFMSMILSFIIFCVLLSLLHVILQAIPGICPSPGEPQSSQFCTVFNHFWHDISIYDHGTQLGVPNEAPEVDDNLSDHSIVKQPVDPIAVLDDFVAPLSRHPHGLPDPV